MERGQREAQLESFVERMLQENSGRGEFSMAFGESDPEKPHLVEVFERHHCVVHCDRSTLHVRVVSRES